MKLVCFVVDYKINMARFNEHVNDARLLKFYKLPIPEISNEMSRTPADFAARIFRSQCTFFTKENYDILVTTENEGSVTNSGTQELHEVFLRNRNGKASYSCECYVNCSIDIPCRHMASRRRRAEPIYRTDDVLRRWNRRNDGAGDTSEVFASVIEAVVLGRPDEDILDDNFTVFPVLAGAKYNELGACFKTVLDMGKGIATEIAKFGHGKRNSHRGCKVWCY